MKIIHTADWHLGKVLHKHELFEEQVMFLQWLISYIRQEKIDAMLISGDVFDLANPSHKDLTLYYNFLQSVSETGIQVIITGGNHDSVSLLQTTQALLSARKIQVIGGLPENREEVVIPIYGKNSEPDCVVLAIPFLRDKDLRTTESADSNTNTQDVIAKAIFAIYDAAIKTAQYKYGPGVPIIAMGHLFMQGSMTSDSEREIHVGNLQGLSYATFPPGIDYFALGHIHKPQRINKSDTIRYSGSPIYLDFSEVGYEKQCILIDISEHDKSFVAKPLPIPCFRQLVRWNGTIEQVKQQILTFKKSTTLPALAEISILEEKYSPDIIREKDDLSDLPAEEVKIIKNRIDFIQKPAELNVWDEGASIKDLTPSEVFQKKLEGFPESDRQELNQCFAGILQEIYQQEI